MKWPHNCVGASGTCQMGNMLGFHIPSRTIWRLYSRLPCQRLGWGISAGDCRGLFSGFNLLNWSALFWTPARNQKKKKNKRMQRLVIKSIWNGEMVFSREFCRFSHAKSFIRTVWHKCFKFRKEFRRTFNIWEAKCSMLDDAKLSFSKSEKWMRNSTNNSMKNKNWRLNVR